MQHIPTGTIGRNAFLDLSLAGVVKGVSRVVPMGSALTNGVTTVVSTGPTVSTAGKL